MATPCICHINCRDELQFLKDIYTALYEFTLYGLGLRSQPISDLNELRSDYTNIITTLKDEIELQAKTIARLDREIKRLKRS
jgi:hypothetical protein